MNTRVKKYRNAFAGEKERKKLTWCARSASALRDSASRSCKLNESNMASDIQRASLDMSANSNKIHR